MATQNDKLVLNTIFNPFEPNLELDDERPDDGVCPVHPNGANQIDYEKFKQIEVEGVKLAEEGKLLVRQKTSSDFNSRNTFAGKLDESLKKFDQVVAEAPGYASGFNNRAQVHQLKGNVERALLDLKKAIQLVDIPDCKCADNNKVLSQALCQRALIYRFQNDETASYADFQKAAALKNEFAKQQVVKLNPYAALCNSMLNQMITKLRNGETEST